MARNMKKLSKELFDLLTSDTQLESKSKSKLRLKTEDDESVSNFQQNFLKNSKVLTKAPSETYVLNNIKICLVSYLDEKYILLTGVHPNDEFDIEDLKAYQIYPEEIYGGSLLLFNSILKLNLKKNISLQDRLENLLYQQEDFEYKGHSTEDIIPYIEDFCLFKVSKDSILNDFEDFEIAYYIICNFQGKFIQLDLPDDTLGEYKKLFRETYSQFKENIFLSLTSTHYKHSFIELYRCLEMIFTLPKSIRLKQSIGFKDTAYELSKICYRELTWKSNERESIKTLFNEIDCEIIFNNKGLKELIGINTDNEKAKNIEKAADFIYKIRNQLVHQIDASAEMTLTKKDWHLLLMFLLYVINNAYLKFKNELP